MINGCITSCLILVKKKKNKVSVKIFSGYDSTGAPPLFSRLLQLSFF